MKVLFYLRKNHEQEKGGDITQIFKTAEGLKKLGVEIDFSSDEGADLSKYDLIHLFNSPFFKENLSYLENAKRQAKPVAFSTIYWPKEELNMFLLEQGHSRKVRLLKKFLGYSITLALYKMRKKKFELNPLEHELFVQADILLPNSEGEMREIERVYGVKKRYAVVRNAVDGELFYMAPSAERENYVLSVGRIELRKNSMALIEAAHEAGVKLVLIGGVRRDIEYNQRCLELIEKYGFIHVDNIPHEELLKYYYKAKVHAMASWYETPGLSSMEAGCGGCIIVSTDRGSTKEYFKDLVFYCDPASPGSIKDALITAMASKPEPKLRELILSEYTWDLAGEDTLAAYKVLLGK